MIMRTSSSSVIFSDNERRVETEIKQLLLDIRRVGSAYPEPDPRVLYGELFDDEEVEQFYEALMGTLKSAKKRGIITFKGQMLLKGFHDNVLISIVGEDPQVSSIDDKGQEKNNPASDSRSDKTSAQAKERSKKTSKSRSRRRVSAPVERQKN